MLVAAGRTSITEKGHVTSRGATIHWAQESFDQAGLVREFVKWDYELRRGEQLETVVDRALAIASNAPSGPVYVTFPLDVAGEALPELAYSSSARLKPSVAAQPEPAAIDRAARALAAADNPLIVVSSVGRDPRAVDRLVALADRLALPVVESWGAYMNFPHDHPLHQGFDPDALVAEADVILVIESDTPWFPNRAEPPARCHRDADRRRPTLRALSHPWLRHRYRACGQRCRYAAGAGFPVGRERAGRNRHRGTASALE